MPRKRDWPAEQSNLFADGSDTSQAAAASVDAASLRAEVFSVIDSSGAYGATCDEVEAALGMRHQTASARVYELAGKGGKLKKCEPRIADTGRRRLTRARRKAVVWCSLRHIGKSSP